MTNREWEKIEKEFDKLYYNRVCRGNHHQPMSGCFCIVKDFFRQKLEEREKEILEKVLEIVKEDREKSEKEFEKLDKSPPDYLWEEAYEEAIRFWEGAVRICKDIEKEIKKLLKRSGIKN